MMQGTQITAHARRLVADIALKQPTFNRAAESLPQPKTLEQRLYREVLLGFLAHEYDDADAINYRKT